MIHRSIFPLILSLSLAAPATLQKGNPELDRLIDSLQARYQKLTTLSADFTQIYNSRGDRTRRESGHVILRKPGKMRWDYSTPEKKLFISDGRTLIEYAPTDGYATRTPVRQSDDLRAPFMFLLGRGNLRREFALIEFSPESPLRAGNRVLRLIPRRNLDFNELILEVDPADLRISRVSMIETGGSRSDFLFSNLRENPPVGDSVFIFKPPAGVEVRN